jgi:Co/Zn/Cd efflux system component
MYSHDLSLWGHSHDTSTEGREWAERRIRLVVALTLGTRVADLVAGWVAGSMALAGVLR